jgi:hypothetical protein
MELGDWHIWWKTDGLGELHQRLLLWWDPIGVKDIPEAQGEYSGYAERLGRMLYEGAGNRELEAFLGEAETGMGISPNTEFDALVARKLLDWYREAMRDRR